MDIDSTLLIYWYLATRLILQKKIICKEGLAINESLKYQKIIISIYIRIIISICKHGLYYSNDKKIALFRGQWKSVK